ncbi:MAG: DUF3473 domain-containing protein [Candidatus Eremiobacteraeota bacterium]|nr:DUF3473 domain-containing protein [Candidatus Eremiobacteraeota bacterium]MCW5868974.1 DUF3473 domain-containing protein [Candidatus Eremiobacteraeota bacterium]
MLDARGRKFLFSVDLEDIRSRIPGGMQKPSRVVVNTERFLRFLQARGAYCTFFVVGELAEQEPELVRLLIDQGHEIAGHSHSHASLQELGPDNFRRDLERNLTSLERIGVPRVSGYRAPRFSLTRATSWAYGIMEEFGLTYSSSVLPAPNPISGWPGFGQKPRRMGTIWEIPISLTDIPGFRVPHTGGVYFRVLPEFLIRFFFHRSMNSQGFVTSYFHPYDVDHEEERVEVPELNGNKLHNWLFYYNRAGLISRLERLAGPKERVTTYRSFIQELT